MPKASPGIQSFNAGELSPRLDGRTDLEKYGSGCRVMENFIPLIQGGAMKRSGTRFVTDVVPTEALCTSGTITWSSSLTVGQTISENIGFQPKILLVQAFVGARLDAAISYGMCGTTATDAHCLGFLTQYDSTSADSDRAIMRSDAIAFSPDNLTSVNWGYLSVQSINSSGFILQVEVASAFNVRLDYLAIGGDAIENAAVSSTSITTGTSYGTGSGLGSDFVLAMALNEPNLATDEIGWDYSIGCASRNPNGIHDAFAMGHYAVFPNPDQQFSCAFPGAIGIFPATVIIDEWTENLLSVTCPTASAFRFATLRARTNRAIRARGWTTSTSGTTVSIPSGGVPLGGAVFSHGKGAQQYRYVTTLSHSISFNNLYSFGMFSGDHQAVTHASATHNSFPTSVNLSSVLSGYSWVTPDLTFGNPPLEQATINLLESSYEFVQDSADSSPKLCFGLFVETPEVGNIRLIDFEFSRDQSYVIEATHGRFRFLRDNALIESLGVPVSISAPYSSSELADLTSWAQSADVLYIAHPSHAPRKLSRFSDTDWVLEEVEFNWPPFQRTNPDPEDYIVSSAATGNVTLTSTGGHFTSGHIGGYIRLEERFDSNHPEWQPLTLDTELETNFNTGDLLWYEQNVYELLHKKAHSRTGTSPPIHEEGTKSDGHWVLEWKHSGSGYVLVTSVTSEYRASGTVVEELPSACVDVDLSITSISNATPPVVTFSGSHPLETGDRIFLFGVTGSASTFNNGVYVVTDTGATTVSLNGQSASGTGTGGTAVRVATGSSDLHHPNGWKDHDLWSFSAFSVANGYPRAVTFFEDRLWWGGTDADPDTVYGSATADYENHQRREGLDDDGVLFTLAARKINVIDFLVPSESMLVGTAGGEYTLGAGDSESALTPGNVRAQQRSTYGARTSVAPVQIDDVVLFVQRSGRKLLEYIFQDTSQSFVGVDLTALAEHITQQKLRGAVFQQSPERILWCWLEDGSLAGLTYERQQQVVAWHRHVLGGSDVRVLSAVVIPHPDGDRDQLWLAVQRTINGETVIHVESMDPVFEDETALEDAFFVDSGLTYSGSPVSTVTGLDHLEDETVSVLADGVDLGARIVASGAISLGGSYSNVQVGLPFSATLAPMRLESGAADGTAQGKIKRIQTVVLRLYRTGKGLYIGDIPENATQEVRDLESGALFSGDTELIPFPGRYNFGGLIALRHTSPTPCMVTAIYPQLHTQDR